MMKLRVLAVFMFTVCCGALALGTDGSDIVDGNITPGQASSSTVQTLVAKDLGMRLGGTEIASKIIIESTGGTLVPAVASVTQAAGTIGVGNLTYSQQATVALMDDLFNKTAPSATFTADMDTLKGTYAAAAANVASSTAGAIGANGGVVDTRMESVMAERRAMVDTFGSNSSLASLAMNSEFSRRVWASPFHLRQEMEAKGAYSAYDYKATGVSLGFDRAFGCLTAGVALTYSRGDYDEAGVRDDNTIENYGASIYLNQYTSSGFFVGVSAGYNYGDNQMKRWVSAGVPGWQRGDNRTDTWWVGGKIGRDFKAGNFTLTPTVGLFWSRSHGSSYTSKGAAGNQHISKIKARSTILPAEVTVRYTIPMADDRSVTLKAGGGYSYNLENKGAKGTMTYDFANTLPVRIQGDKPGRSSWNAGAGIQYRHKNFDIGIDYRYDGKSKFDSHRVTGTIGLNF